MKGLKDWSLEETSSRSCKRYRFCCKGSAALGEGIRELSVCFFKSKTKGNAIQVEVFPKGEKSFFGIVKGGLEYSREKGDEEYYFDSLYKSFNSKHSIYYNSDIYYVIALTLNRKIEHLFVEGGVECIDYYKNGAGIKGILNDSLSIVEAVDPKVSQIKELMLAKIALSENQENKESNKSVNTKMREYTVDPGVQQEFNSKEQVLVQK